jgi:hypothetical protein
MEQKFHDEEQVSATFPEQNTRRTHDEVNIGKRDQVLRAKDAVFEGKGVRRSHLPPVRDATLLHTDLKPKNKSDESSAGGGDKGPETHLPSKKRDKPDGKDKDISWI